MDNYVSQNMQHVVTNSAITLYSLNWKFTVKACKDFQTYFAVLSSVIVCTLTRKVNSTARHACRVVSARRGHTGIGTVGGHVTYDHDSLELCVDSLTDVCRTLNGALLYALLGGITQAKRKHNIILQFIQGESLA